MLKQTRPCCCLHCHLAAPRGFFPPGNSTNSWLEKKAQWLPWVVSPTSARQLFLLGLLCAHSFVLIPRGFSSIPAAVCLCSRSAWVPPLANRTGRRTLTSFPLRSSGRTWVALRGSLWGRMRAAPFPLHSSSSATKKLILPSKAIVPLEEERVHWYETQSHRVSLAPAVPPVGQCCCSSCSYECSVSTAVWAQPQIQALLPGWIADHWGHRDDVQQSPDPQDVALPHISRMADGKHTQAPCEILIAFLCFL